MKKRLVATALAVLTLLCLVGCGEKESNSDLSYVQEKGTLVIGITNFDPMDYPDENGAWVGFDADMARAFAESLGVQAEFVEIVWDNKIMELNDKGIDCVWNGMTLNDAVKNAMSASNAYCKNAQVVVMRSEKAKAYPDIESLRGLKFAVEAGSAGAAQLDKLDISYMKAESQADALMEVKAGASDACVIDLLMAGAMLGEGTAYPDLTYTLSLNSEEYGVGFRKGSDLTQRLNEFFADSYTDGSMLQIAERYGVQESLIEQ